MRTLFTIHAGEYLIGEHLESKYGKHVEVWVPAKDSGVDLLITAKESRKYVSLQAKYSRDFLLHDFPADLRKSLRSCGWWKINLLKLRKSSADYWVFAVMGAKERTTDYIVIEPQELQNRLKKNHGTTGTANIYFFVTESGQCWEARGLKRDAQREIAGGGYRDAGRNFTSYLNNWKPIERLLGKRASH